MERYFSFPLFEWLMIRDSSTASIRLSNRKPRDAKSMYNLEDLFTQSFQNLKPKKPLENN